MFEGIEAIKRILEQQRQFEKLLNPASLSLINQTMQQHRQFEVLLGPTNLSFINQVLEQHRQTQALLNSFNIRLTNQLPQITPILSKSALTWNSSLSTAIQKLYNVTLFSSHPLLAQ